MTYRTMVKLRFISGTILLRSFHLPPKDFNYLVFQSFTLSRHDEISSRNAPSILNLISTVLLKQFKMRNHG